MNEGINLAAVCIADGFGVSVAVMMLGAKIWRREKYKKEGGYLRWMLVTALLACIADIIAFSFDGKPGRLAYHFVSISNFYLYCSNMIIGTLWVKILVSRINGKLLPLYQRILTIFLDVVGVTALLINFFVPIVYEISSENVYQRGRLYWMFMAIEAFLP